MSNYQLMAISGPIGDGKSSTAIAVTGLFRAEGIATAVIDLYDIYLMARPYFYRRGIYQFPPTTGGRNPYKNKGKSMLKMC